MARIVVVASSELDRDALASILEPDDELHVVVAAVEQSRLQWLANDEGDARRQAEQVGRTIGTDAPAEPSSIEVKPDAPSQLVLDAVREFQPDRVVVAVREGEDATWLEEGELDQIRAQIEGVPVSRLTL